MRTMNGVALVLSFLLLADADVPRAMGLRSAEGKATFSREELALFSPLESSDQNPGQNPAAPRKDKLQESTKLELIRYVSGEFAKAAKSLPAGKDGFLQHVDKPLNQELLDRAVATHGAAVRAGDNAQITKLEFRDHTIVVDVNGGGRGKKHFQIGRAHV